MTVEGRMERRDVDLERRLAAYAEAVGEPGDPARTDLVRLDLGCVEDDVRYELDVSTDGALLSLGSTGRCGPAPESATARPWLPLEPAGYGSLELLALGARGVRDWRRKREAIEPAA